MIEILLDEVNNLEYILSIEGTNSPLKEVYLTIMQPNYKVSFPGYLKDGKVSFTIPILGNLLKEGVYDYRIEVLVADRHFIPLEDQMGMKKSVKVETIFSKTFNNESLKNDIDKHVSTPTKQIVIEKTNDDFLSRAKQFIEG